MKHLLIEARQEILDLRRSNEILSAQMGVVEVFAAVLGLKRREGASVDVAWALQRKIDELSAPANPPGEVCADSDETASGL